MTTTTLIAQCEHCGYYGPGFELIDQGRHGLRQICPKCDNLQGHD